MKLPLCLINQLRYSTGTWKSDSIKIIAGNAAPKRVGHGHEKVWKNGGWKTLRKADWTLQVGSDYLLNRYANILAIYRLSNYDESRAAEAYINLIKTESQLQQSIIHNQIAFNKLKREWSFDEEEDQKLYA